ncbi:MAG: Dam family site-specific DNA-(adenine-N6)-methyltransferase [Nitrososphaeria archaeon]
MFPRDIKRVIVPPIKCQGIKTKLVRFILSNIKWDGSGRWIEPFLGSGVVLFNARPKQALASDINKHIIALYTGIQKGIITPDKVKFHLEREGDLLLKKGEHYYYEVRERFNREGNPLDLLFLSRACFNGVMRFNQKGEFNVPFCRKIDRFRKAYITKIVNQVRSVARVMQGKDWMFECLDWREALENCRPNDFVYADPPYVGRHTDYYNRWSEKDLKELADKLHELPCGWALSLWKQNKYRRNELIEKYFPNLPVRTFSHEYFVGSFESLRNEMEEALIIKKGFEVAEKSPIQITII